MHTLSLRRLLLGALVLFAPATFAQGAPGAGELALAPSRFELPMEPGTEQTVVVNVISSGAGAGAAPLRLLASLGDWSASADGQLQFAKPGTLPGSAAPWMIYSPVELTVKPGSTHSIRVTVSVPKDATPGDHTAVLFVEERPGDIRTKRNVKQLVFHFRLAAIFYVMVPPFTAKGSLVNLVAAPAADGLQIRPTLKNEGNVHLRPVQSFQLLDAAGNVVAEQTPADAAPVMANAHSQQVLTVTRPLPPGEYSLRYRVDFKDGGKVIEGRTRVRIPAEPAPRSR